MKPRSPFSSVKLTAPEILEAVIAGALRRYKAVLKGTKPRYDFESEDPWGSDIEAACAERLVAKATGTYWIGSVLRADAGADAGKFGVRQTLLKNGGLILHVADEDEQWFYLVIGAVPNQRIVGKLLAKDGKRKEYWRTDVRTPCFIVPQGKIHET